MLTSEMTLDRDGRQEVIADVTQVSLLRLYALRATYLLIAVGLGIDILPAIIHHAKPWELWQGVVCSVLGAVSALALLGIRYPLQMLPLLFFEMVWKSIWLVVVALPLWFANQPMDARTSETVLACLMGVIFPVVIPWRYVVANFVMRRGERWR